MGTANLVKEKVVKFKLQNFCWLGPVHYGVLILGYFNLFFSVVSLLSTANDSFSPTLKKLQEEILDLETNHKTACTLAYCAEEAINVILLLGVHRRDVVLLTLYVFLGSGAAGLFFFIFVIVVMRIDLVISMCMLLEIGYQCYFLLLVRSEVVNIKEQRKQLELKIEEEKNKIQDVEVAGEIVKKKVVKEDVTEKVAEVSQESGTLEKKKLETVVESSDEESSSKD